MINIDKFASIHALVIGDLMIDEYLWGKVEKISPEAPVPVVSVEKENSTLGGAGNVIHNLVAMGAAVSAIGAAGKGKAGQMIFDKLAKLGINTDGIFCEPDRPTTRKTRVIAENQQVLRIDKEIKSKIAGATLIKLKEAIDKKISRVNLVILSDYDKGLITRDLVSYLVSKTNQQEKPILADPKSINFSKYKNVSVLTPNKKEAGFAANMDIKTDQDIRTAGEKLIEQVALDRLLITCGKDGMVLFEKKKKPFTIASKARQVFDVSGAGDTVISLLGLGLAVGGSFRESARVANVAAGIVVGKVGTATASIEELKQALKK